MCGIVGVVAGEPIAQILVDGLKRLEYRGYDSAGIAVIDEKNTLQRLRVKGKVKELATALEHSPLSAHLGIAHTRWATHGAPSEHNAHPLVSHDHIAVVHNGIIENHLVLRKKLIDAGYQFVTETDSETVVHLIHFHYQQHPDLIAAVKKTVSELEGAYALAIFSLSYPGHVLGVRQGAPLVVGIGSEANYIASDPLALLSHTQDFIYLEDYDIVDITDTTFQIYDKAGSLIKRDIHAITMQEDAVERGEYQHYMLKEIVEQPKAIADCLQGRLTQSHVLPAIFGPQLDDIFPNVQHIQFVACGTSYHAALVAKYWLEALANIPCSVEVASEFRYRKIADTKNSLYVTLSQSGETADALAALRLSKKMSYLHNLVICNVPGSTMVREADSHFLTRAGIEIGVASTKAFITQLTALFLLALSLRRAKRMHNEVDQSLTTALLHMPVTLQDILKNNEQIASWAQYFTDKFHALFLGRGTLYPIALEGALKMKEISYIHAEGYPSGELKHGPLALVDNTMPVIATVPNDEWLEKTLSNLQEVNSRGGKLFVFADPCVLGSMLPDATVMTLPSVPALLAPLAYTIPLQLLSYHVAVLKGTDVDQPRNLAKSVTVE